MSRPLGEHYGTMGLAAAAVGLGEPSSGPAGRVLLVGSSVVPFAFARLCRARRKKEKEKKSSHAGHPRYCKEGTADSAPTDLVNVQCESTVRHGTLGQERTHKAMLLCLRIKRRLWGGECMRPEDQWHMRFQGKNKTGAT